MLNVRDVREDEVISEWPPTVTATRLLAAQQGELPLEVILAWLPKLAKTIDWVREHGLGRVGLDPARWQIAFESLLENETPAEHAARPPGEWGAHYVFFDPLAGFDPGLAAATIADDRTLLPQTAASLTTPAECRSRESPLFIRCAARAVRKFLRERMEKVWGDRVRRDG